MVPSHRSLAHVPLCASGSIDSTPARATSKGTSAKRAQEEQRHKRQLLHGRITAAEFEANSQQDGVADNEADREQRINAALFGDQNRHRDSGGDKARRGDARYEALPRFHPSSTSLTSLPNQLLGQEHWEMFG